MREKILKCILSGFGKWSRRRGWDEATADGDGDDGDGDGRKSGFLNGTFGQKVKVNQKLMMSCIRIIVP